MGIDNKKKCTVYSLSVTGVVSEQNVGIVYQSENVEIQNVDRNVRLTTAKKQSRAKEKQPVQ